MGSMAGCSGEMGFPVSSVSSTSMALVKWSTTHSSAKCGTARDMDDASSAQRKA